MKTFPEVLLFILVQIPQNEKQRISLDILNPCQVKLHDVCYYPISTIHTPPPTHTLLAGNNVYLMLIMEKAK